MLLHHQFPNLIWTGFKLYLLWGIRSSPVYQLLWRKREIDWTPLSWKVQFDLIWDLVFEKFIFSLLFMWVTKQLQEMEASKNLSIWSNEMQQASMNPSHNPCISKANKRYLHTYFLLVIFFFHYGGNREHPPKLRLSWGARTVAICVCLTLTTSSLKHPSTWLKVNRTCCCGYSVTKHEMHAFPITDRTWKGIFLWRVIFFMGTGWTKLYGHMLCTKYNNCSQFI